MKKKESLSLFLPISKFYLCGKSWPNMKKGDNIIGLTLTLNSYTNSLHIILSMSAVMNVNWQGYITTP